MWFGESEVNLQNGSRFTLVSALSPFLYGVYLMCFQRYAFNPWVGKTPWRRWWQPTPVFLPGESHGWTEEPGGLQSMGSQKGWTWWTTKRRRAHTHCQKVTSHKWHHKILWAISSLLHQLLSETSVWVVRTAIRRDDRLGGLNNRRWLKKQKNCFSHSTGG